MTANIANLLHSSFTASTSFPWLEHFRTLGRLLQQNWSGTVPGQGRLHPHPHYRALAPRAQYPADRVDERSTVFSSHRLRR